MKKIISIILSLTMILSFSPVTYAESSWNIDAVISDNANYIYKTVSNPQVGSIGGEWAILGLARSGEDIPPEYFENYYQTAQQHV